MRDIESLVHSAPIVLFMKGTPAAPACGFSGAVVQLLDFIKAPFSSFDVLEDENIRQGIKTYSNWPTIPQIYVKGEFIGGHDIVMEMYRSGTLKAKLQLEK